MYSAWILSNVCAIGSRVRSGPNAYSRQSQGCTGGCGTSCLHILTLHRHNNAALLIGHQLSCPPPHTWHTHTHTHFHITHTHTHNASLMHTHMHTDTLQAQNQHARAGTHPLAIQAAFETTGHASPTSHPPKEEGEHQERRQLAPLLLQVSDVIVMSRASLGYGSHHVVM